MADSFIQLPADSTGKSLDTALVNMGVGTTAVHREKVVLSDPLSTAGFATVTSSAGVLASLSSGTVSLSSQITVTATAGTNPWSSAPGFNLPVVTVSSGLVQLSGVPLVAVTSSALSLVALGTTAPAAVLVTSSGGPVFSAGVNTAAGYGPVTSSAGRLASLSSGTVTLSSLHTVTATGPVTVTSGLISVTSGTITSTAATNPWSSAPGFNLPVVSVSSGIVQLSSQITVTATGPVTITSGTVTLSSIHTIFSASSGGVQAFIPISPTSSVAGAGFGPVTSSAGVLASLSSGTVSLSSQITVTATAGTNPWSSAPGFNVPVVSVSSGLVQISGTPTVTATAATNPWSSAPGFNVPVVTVSSGFIRAFPVGAVTTSGLSAFHRMTTGGAAAAVITTAASALYGYAIFNSSASPRTTKFYNSTAPTVGGSTANLLLSVQAPGSTGGGGANMMLPIGIYSSNGWSCIITAGMGDTDTGAPGTNDISCGVFYQT